jgi:riboflavin biosynthesis pyrimidine reductase
MSGWRVRQLAPTPGQVDPYEAYAYPDRGVRPVGRPWVRANMISTVDGAITGTDGRSGGIGTAADRRMFGVLRDLADVVLVGAGTARTEGYRPSRLPIALVTARLDLDLASPLLAAAEHRTLVITAADADPDRLAATNAVADVVACGRGAVDLAGALAALADRGFHDVLCEGGPALLASLLAAGLVDELCVSTAPVLAGSGAGPARILTGPPLPAAVPLTLGHLLDDEGTLFARWLVGPTAPAG